MRELVAALERLRARLNDVIGALEKGKHETALEELEKLETEWSDAMRGLRP